MCRNNQTIACKNSKGMSCSIIIASKFIYQIKSTVVRRSGQSGAQQYLYRLSPEQHLASHEDIGFCDGDAGHNIICKVGKCQKTGFGRSRRIFAVSRVRNGWNDRFDEDEADDKIMMHQELMLRAHEHISGLHTPGCMVASSEFFDRHTFWLQHGVSKRN
jgi:hypothetical protein